MSKLNLKLRVLDRTINLRPLILTAFYLIWRTSNLYTVNENRRMVNED
jgi:hypothetical protein